MLRKSVILATIASASAFVAMPASLSPGLRTSSNRPLSLRGGAAAKMVNGKSAKVSAGGGMAVVTDATNASDAECLAAALLFLPPSPAPSFSRCSGGVNNIVFYIDRPGLPRLVLRIYNNGKNTARVVYEHAVLSLVAPLRLPFATPRCLPALSDGSTFALLPGGEACCVTECIAGGPAGNGSARSIGAATATLVRAMEGLTVPAGVAAVNPLYRNLYDAHHTISPSTFAALVETEQFDSVREHIDFLRGAIARAEALIVRIMAMSPPLPTQLINADLHTDNVLVDDAGGVTGVLDFEFCAVDWRVMELVVGVSKYCGAPDPKPLLEEYVAGYAEAGGVLTQAEVALASQLVQLRILNNVVYFAGRALAGEDSVEPLRGRAEMYANRCKWLDAHESYFCDLLAPLVK